jgi:hypothetical protein
MASQSRCIYVYVCVFVCLFVCLCVWRIKSSQKGDKREGLIGVYIIHKEGLIGVYSIDKESFIPVFVK